MNLWPSLAKKKALRLVSFTGTTIGAIFEILEKNLYSAILRIASPGERINAGMVYETIWTWFIKDFENEKAGITKANPKRGIWQKANEPKKW